MQRWDDATWFQQNIYFKSPQLSFYLLAGRTPHTIGTSPLKHKNMVVKSLNSMERHMASTARPWLPRSTDNYRWCCLSTYKQKEQLQCRTFRAIRQQSGTMPERGQNEVRNSRMATNKAQKGIDPRHIWNVIYNARSNRGYPPTSPNAAPATNSDTWTSPNSAPATKSAAWTSPNSAPAMKSDTCTSRPYASLLYSSLLFAALLYSYESNLLHANLFSNESDLWRILFSYESTLLRNYSQTNLISDESILRRIYSLTNLFSYESVLLRIYSQTNLISTNLFSDESILLRIYSQTNLISYESILLRISSLMLFGSRSYIGSFSSKLPLMILIDFIFASHVFPYHTMTDVCTFGKDSLTKQPL